MYQIGIGEYEGGVHIVYLYERGMCRCVCGCVECKNTFTLDLWYTYSGICLCDICYVMNTRHVNKYSTMHGIDKCLMKLEET